MCIESKCVRHQSGVWYVIVIATRRAAAGGYGNSRAPDISPSNHPLVLVNLPVWFPKSNYVSKRIFFVSRMMCVLL